MIRPLRGGARTVSFGDTRYYLPPPWWASYRCGSCGAMVMAGSAHTCPPRPVGECARCGGAIFIGWTHVCVGPSRTDDVAGGTF
ncbi:MAG: hypothetical protein IVW52_05145 [Acidimicrobiales bacterium]|nr:hypothetical protein [Acidimicrobiales bacterium]